MNMGTKRIERKICRNCWHVNDACEELKNSGYKQYISYRDGRKIPECREVVRIYLTTGGGVYTISHRLIAVYYI